jgi:hypothetical protein
MTIIIVVIATIYAVYNILISFGVFEFSTRPKKTVNEIEEKRKKSRKRKWETKKLGLYSSVIAMFYGIFMNDIIYANHEYYIQRLELRSEPLGRLLTPEEVRGKYAFYVVISLFAIPIGLFYPVALLLPVITLMMITLLIYICYCTLS